MPSSLYKANPGAKFGFNPKADRFVAWEAQIRDVCVKCNGVHLAKLDNYAHQFYLENHIDHLITDEKRVPLVYDFSLLTRFLLKVTFNCLRFKGQDTEWMRPFSDYILYGLRRPAKLGAKFGVEVTPCHKITESDRPHLAEGLESCEYLPPMNFRFGQASGTWSGQIFGRYVFLNNFCFYVLVFRRSIAKDVLQAALEDFRSACPNVTFLNPHLRAVTIKVSSTTAQDRYKDTAWALIDKWHEHVRRRGQQNP